MQLPLAKLEVPVAEGRVRAGRKSLADETALSAADQEKIRRLIRKRDSLPSGPRYRKQRLNIGCHIWRVRHPNWKGDPNALRTAKQRWLKNNRELRKKVARDYYYRNRTEPKPRLVVWKANAVYTRKRRRNDPNFALLGRLRATMNRAFRRNWIKKPARTESLLGCTISQAKAHIESQFVNGMDWKNRRSFVIDHFVPAAAFDVRDAEQAYWAFNWRNLRPITPHENAVKSDKLPNPLPSWLPPHIAARILSRSRRPAHPRSLSSLAAR